MVIVITALAGWAREMRIRVVNWHNRKNLLTGRPPIYEAKHGFYHIARHR